MRSVEIEFCGGDDNTAMRVGTTTLSRWDVPEASQFGVSERYWLVMEARSVSRSQIAERDHGMLGF